MKLVTLYIAIIGITVITCAHLQEKVSQHKAPPVVASQIGERP